MKIIFYILALYASIFIFYKPCSSQKNIDSLLLVLKNKKDTVRVNALNELAREFLSKDFEKSFKYANEALTLAKVKKFEEGEASALQNIGSYYKKKSDTEKALDFYTKALNLRIKNNDTLGIPRSYNAIGDIYYNRDKTQEALQYYNNALVKYKEAIELYSKQNNKKLKLPKKALATTLLKIGNVYLTKINDNENAVIYYQKALKIFEEISDKPGIANCENNIALLYMHITNLDDTVRLVKSLDYLKRALDINMELKNNVEIANSNCNIGLFYLQMAEIYVKKLENIKNLRYLDKTKLYEHKIKVYVGRGIGYFLIGLNIRTELGDEAGKASILNNLGTAYSFLQNYSLAIEYYINSLKINEKHKIKKEIATNCFYIGQSYLYLKKYNVAIDFFNRSLIVSNDINDKIVKKENYRYLSSVYDSLKNFQSAYFYFKAYSEINDTIYKESSDKTIQELNTKYETGKKEQENKLLTKDNLLKQSQIKQQRILIVVFVLVFVIIVIFSLLLYKQYHEKNKANKELQIKNNLITLQKNEITDSIHYAKRIQSAILPHEDNIGKIIREHFVMYKPKDIVSGDFYWFKRFEHVNLSIIAAADCTGHGVPGAFMSLLGATFLNEIMNGYSYTPDKEIKASDILNKLRDKIIISLNQTGKIGEQKDGMDISLCLIDTTNKIVDFAGANNPLYVIRENNLIELKGDKMPIGIHDRTDVPFTSHLFNYHHDDIFYIFSDGFKDQFGGKDGKKYLTLNFKKLLLSIHGQTMAEQCRIIENESNDWRKDLEQIDDQLIIGFKL